MRRGMCWCAIGATTFAMFFGNSAHGQLEYHVDQAGGDDDNSGLGGFGNAFATLQKALTT